MDDNETIADIIAEMRGMGNYQRYSGDHARVLADRLEAAHKRERGDCAKLREALKLCMDEMCNRCRDLASARGNPLPCLQGCEPVRKAKAALSAPPRNCDRFKTAAEAIDAYQDLTGDQLATDSGMKEWVEFAVCHFADRLEAAHKRERGDAAKLREALVRVLDWLKRMNAQPLNTLAVSELTPSYAVNRTAKSIIEDNDYHISQLTAALAAPPRNCDVGTAEEQIERWQAFCNRYDDDCTGCPCEAADTWNYTTCFAKWTQLPYEGGAK